VGARRGTPYGLEVARALGLGISAAGATVVSGLALGVDSAAHVGALSARPAAPVGALTPRPAAPVGSRAARPAGPVGALAGRPAAPAGEPASAAAPCRGAGPVVAVLAGGADVPYPARNRRLHRQVAAVGCVVSELPPGFAPHRWAFVARNRIIAGLAARSGRDR
jgi:DNA processing protein